MDKIEYAVIGDVGMITGVTDKSIVLATMQGEKILPAEENLAYIEAYHIGEEVEIIEDDCEVCLMFRDGMLIATGKVVLPHA